MKRLFGAITLLLCLAGPLVAGPPPPPPCKRPFLRGDSTSDAVVDISDGVSTLNVLFSGNPPPSCLDAADINDSGDLDIADGVFTFNFLFVGGPSPPLPGAACGPDPTDDTLDCAAFEPCADQLPPEACDNGIDDDCDGDVDEDCSCISGEKRPCGTTDTGECSLGVQTCVGETWGPCEGSAGPGNELCDFLDNDCEGTIDNGFDEDEDGWTTCAGDCDDENGSVNPAVPFDALDGIDNDCDEEVDEGPFTSTHAAAIQPIWTRSCTTSPCHDASFPQANLDLTPASAFIELVNKRSGQAPLDLVEPLDPQRSYLWHKLNNTQRTVGGSGNSMPNGLPLLPEADRRRIEQWILEGCPP